MKPLYAVGWLITRIIATVCFRYRYYHGERVPHTGGVIVAMNHESFLDPNLAGLACGREIYFLARKSLQKWPIVGYLLPKVNTIYVDQERADMTAIKTIIRLVRNGECALIFPEGGRTFDGNLQPAQPGLGLIIAKTLAPVVPMRIFGARAAMPRGGSGVKFKKVHTVVGEPIRLTEADLVGTKREVYQRLSDRVMEKIAELRPVE